MSAFCLRGLSAIDILTPHHKGYATTSSPSNRFTSSLPAKWFASMANLQLSKEFQAEDGDIILRSADKSPSYERFKDGAHSPASAYTVFQPVRLFRVHTAILGAHSDFAEPLKKALAESKEPLIDKIPVIKVSEGKLILEHVLRFIYGNVDNQSDWHAIGATELVETWQTAYKYKLSVLQAVAESFLM